MSSKVVAIININAGIAYVNIPGMTAQVITEKVGAVSDKKTSIVMPISASAKVTTSHTATIQQKEAERE